MKLNKIFSGLSVFVVLVSLLGVVPAGAAPSSPPVIPDSKL